MHKDERFSVSGYDNSMLNKHETRNKLNKKNIQYQFALDSPQKGALKKMLTTSQNQLLTTSQTRR